MTGRLVHTGQVIVDLVMRVGELPVPGGDVLAGSHGLSAGGGFNVMAAAARSGARVRYAGAHGTGRFGDQARAALRTEGIEVDRPPSAERDTGVCVVLVDPSGERTFVTGTGAEGFLPAHGFSGIETTSDDLVYVSGYSLLHESNRAALLEWLPVVRAKVLFDPGPLAAEIDHGTMAIVLSTVDIVSGNAREAQSLSGTDDLESAAQVLAERIGGTAVVRNGPAGCVLAHRGELRVVPGFPVKPVDTNGAGDTHCGVLAAALLAGASPEAAAVRANAAAALSVLREGPATAPAAAEIDRFLAD
ncbi:PfkB family carbohydrate kinase [Amycolatopsis jiangsuensis]|uniref:Sugar/nucleoside kinase (Ribokinase family) n=1 Tax=Amycolatopsis jiangsuensis TaxID=1181879 RepID=A0A840IN98_9PSEU|nr:PfkB family carbohydrate kinase [Amycolatopsis jiangsuensis]MBB4683420.1 sugar/nucleoside kinase (ribokinase family) [Amycolatopsis jiangsuensis]